MHGSLAQAVGRLSRAAYVATVVLVCVGWALAGVVRLFFSTQARSWLALASALPVLLFLLSLYFYEGRGIHSDLSSKFWRHSLLSCLFLLSLPAFIVLRFFWVGQPMIEIGRWVAFSILAYFLLGITVAEAVEQLRPVAFVVSQIKDVMWDAWQEPFTRHGPLIRLTDLDDDGLRRRRGMYYLAKPALIEFQASLTCPAFDSQAVLDALKGRALATDLSVLDVGGGDGAFTAALLRGLRDSGVSQPRVTMIDPVEWSAEYSAQILGAVPNARVQVLQKSLAEFNAPGDFGLVVASHSLYNMCDGATDPARRLAACQAALAQLLRFRAEGGVCVVILASGRGVSYRFKHSALRLLFGRKVHDTVAEDFKPTALQYHVDPIYVDNAIDLTRALDDLEQRRDGVRLGRWLSYFLRAGVDADPFILLELGRLLEGHVIRFVELAETERARIRGLLMGNNMQLLDDSRVLLHKTAVFVL